MNNVKTNGKLGVVFWIKYSILIFAIIGVIAYFLRINDAALGGIEDYLIDNQEIRTQVGEVKGYHIVTSTYISASVDKEKHNIYKIDVYGESQSITIKLKAVNTINSSSWSYSIIKFYQ